LLVDKWLFGGFELLALVTPLCMEDVDDEEALSEIPYK
jgi:hypothetical protein